MILLLYLICNVKGLISFGMLLFHVLIEVKISTQFTQINESYRQIFYPLATSRMTHFLSAYNMQGMRIIGGVFLGNVRKEKLKVQCFSPNIFAI